MHLGTTSARDRMQEVEEDWRSTTTDCLFWFNNPLTIFLGFSFHSSQRNLNMNCSVNPDIDHSSPSSSSDSTTQQVGFYKFITSEPDIAALSKEEKTAKAVILMQLRWSWSSWSLRWSRSCWQRQGRRSRVPVAHKPSCRPWAAPMCSPGLNIHQETKAAGSKTISIGY